MDYLFRVPRSQRLSTYEDLLRRYVAPLRRLVWAYEREPSAREDLFQEIAMALWTALPRFRGDASERTWIYRVAHNTAISFVANRRRRHGREGGEAAREPADLATPERAAIEQQRREWLQRAVRDLPLPDRQVVVLYLEGLSATEIQEVTGISAAAVATRLTRIRQKLAARIAERGNQEVR